MAEQPNRTNAEGGLREKHKRGRRSAIMRAVRELLREGADDKLTKESIAQRADVAPATVYNLVGTRAKIFEALAEDFMNDVETRLQGEPVREPLARARRIVDVILDLILADPLVYTRMVRGWDESGLVLRRGPASNLIAAFEEAKELGVLMAEADARLLASSVATACVGAVHQWAAGLISARGFRARALFSLDLALAAAASETHRSELVRALVRARSRAEPSTSISGSRPERARSRRSSTSER
jgi:AcrR family transcriptional regulator